MTREEYKEILENNGYINLVNVINFLRENCIADYEVIAEIYNKGMSIRDWKNLQEALDELNI